MDALQEDVPFIKLYQESLLNYLALGVPAAFLTMTFRLSLLNTAPLVVDIYSQEHVVVNVNRSTMVVEVCQVSRVSFSFCSSRLSILSHPSSSSSMKHWSATYRQ